MIISIIANALVQCMARTQAGWMTLAGSRVAEPSVAARLDMCCSLKILTTYTPKTPDSLLPEPLSGRYPKRIVHKKASRESLPGSPSRVPRGTGDWDANAQEAGS